MIRWCKRIATGDLNKYIIFQFNRNGEVFVNTCFTSFVRVGFSASGNPTTNTDIIQLTVMRLGRQMSISRRRSRWVNWANAHASELIKTTEPERSAGYLLGYLATQWRNVCIGRWSKNCAITNFQNTWVLRNLKLAILRHFEVGDSHLIKFRVIFSVGYYDVWVKAPDSSDCGVLQGALVSRAICGCVPQGVSGGSTFKCLYGKLWKKRWRCLGRSWVKENGSVAD